MVAREGVLDKGTRCVFPDKRPQFNSRLLRNERVIYRTGYK